MFKLVKTDTANRNIFKLLVQLNFLDREPSEVFQSPVFRCRTRSKPGKGKSHFALLNYSVAYIFSKLEKRKALLHSYPGPAKSHKYLCENLGI